jgi:hypothetical protein
VDSLGNGGGDVRIELDAPAVERDLMGGRRQGNVNLNLNGGRIWESCGDCNYSNGDRRRGGGRANVDRNRIRNVLR